MKEKTLFMSIVMIAVMIVLAVCLGYFYNESNKEEKVCPNVDTSSITKTLKDNQKELIKQQEDIKNQIYLKKTNCNPTYILEGCKSTIENIATDLSKARDYELDVYDCTEFSQTLSGVYNDLGYKAKTKSVQVDCNSGLFENIACSKYNGWHSIVELDNVYVESTTGDIITPDKYKFYGLR